MKRPGRGVPETLLPRGLPSAPASGAGPGAGSAVAWRSDAVPCHPSTGSLSSGKASQDRKLTSTPREIAKSPHSAVPEHHAHPISSYEHLLRGVSGVDLYRGHIPLAFDPTSIPRGIPLDAGDCPKAQGLGASSASARGLLRHRPGCARWGS